VRCWTAAEACTDRRESSCVAAHQNLQANAGTGTFCFLVRSANALWGVAWGTGLRMEAPMNGLIYLIGLIVVIMAVLSLLGLR
jgi:hypothetical protein